MRRRLSIWAPLPPAALLRRPQEPLPFPLDRPDCRVMAWGRHGVWHGVRSLGLGEGDAVLVPAYHHGSEVEALVRAGLTCRFYEATEDLEPPESSLEDLLDERVRALYLIHPLGFPRDAARWRAWCDRRGLLLIEDAAQAWLATRDGVAAGAAGDLTLFCLYKSVGLNEGAAALARVPLPDVPLDPRLGTRAIARHAAMWAAGRSGAVYAASWPFRRPRPYSPARDFELRDPHVGPWRHTPFLLRRLADPSAAARRRANYRVLLGHLRAGVPAPFGAVPAGASPFVFPIVVRDPQAAAERLNAAGVGHLHLWSTPHPSLPAGDFPAAAARRRATLGLPVHQELRPRDLADIARAARDLLA